MKAIGIILAGGNNKRMKELTKKRTEFGLTTMEGGMTK